MQKNVIFYLYERICICHYNMLLLILTPACYPPKTGRGFCLYHKKLRGTKEATHKHSPVFRTSAAIVCLRSPESGALLMTYWVPPIEVSRERGAASHTSSHPSFPSALLVVQCPNKRVWPFGTFHWRPYLRLALKYTFPRARPKPANVGKNGPYPFTVCCPVPTTGPVLRSLQAVTANPQL